MCLFSYIFLKVFLHFLRFWFLKFLILYSACHLTTHFLPVQDVLFIFLHQNMCLSFKLSAPSEPLLISAKEARWEWKPDGVVCCLITGFPVP